MYAGIEKGGVTLAGVIIGNCKFISNIIQWWIICYRIGLEESRICIS